MAAAASGGGGGGFGTTAAILAGVVAVAGLVALVGVVKFCRKTKRSSSTHSAAGGDGGVDATPSNAVQSSTFSIQSQASALSTAE